MFTEQHDHCRHHYDLQENSEIHGKMLSEFQMSATKNKWVQHMRCLFGRGRLQLLEGPGLVCHLIFRNANCWKICYSL